MPDVPTFKEFGLNIIYEVARGLMVPKGTPETVRAKLGDACGKAAKEPEFAAAMKLQGTKVAYLDAKAYGEFLAKIDAENRTIVSELGLAKK